MGLGVQDSSVSSPPASLRELLSPFPQIAVDTDRIRMVSGIHVATTASQLEGYDKFALLSAAQSYAPNNPAVRLLEQLSRESDSPTLSRQQLRKFVEAYRDQQNQDLSGYTRKGPGS